jgi:hypothetical protein
MGFFRNAWIVRGRVHPAFWVVPSFVIGALVALFVNADDKIAPAVISLFGVLVGGTLTGMIGLIVANTTQRAQLTTSIWPARMKAHQEAFKQWARCKAVMYDDKRRDQTLYEARQWWDENCLYLSDTVSQRFFNMIIDVKQQHHLLKAMESSRDRADRDAFTKNLDAIMETAKIIAEGAGRHIPEEFIKEISRMSDEAKQPESGPA